jgi:hypothetical protein
MFAEVVLADWFFGALIKGFYFAASLVECGSICELAILAWLAAGCDERPEWVRMAFSV